MGSVQAERLAQMMVELAIGPVDGEPETALALLARYAAEYAGAAVGLITCSTGPSPDLVIGSDDRVRRLELHQRQAGDGPVVDALRDGSPGGSASLLEARHRWPTYAPLALEAGFAVVHTLILGRSGTVVGALEVLSEGGQQPDPGQLAVVQALADVATVTLLRDHDLVLAQRLAGQLQEALTSRIPIEQAKGALGQLHGIDPEEAFGLLRGYARSHRRNLTEVAVGWLRSPEQFPELGVDAGSR
jgi:hypothetical protein